MRKFKKFKKILTGILSAAMVMSTMTAAGFAADYTTTAVIDTTNNVSLTIHKYEFDGTGGTGTGSETDTVPTGATALPGVEFTVYKVGEINQTTNSGTTAINFKPVAELSSIGAEITNATVLTTDNLNAVTTKYVKTTDKNGEITLTNTDGLTQGLYYVVETKAPDKVTGKVDPFYVSLPSTTADGTAWLYNVNVYPKNKTTLSAITLKKQGVIGNQTATYIAAEFVLQKKSGNEWANVTDADVKVGTNAISSGAVAVPANASGVTVSGLSQGTYRFVEKANTGGYITDSSKTYEFAVAADGTVSGTGVTDSTLTVTNYKPEIEKKIKENGKDSYADAADYSVGDYVPFKITVTVPANISDLKHYVLTDTMETGLVLDDSAAFSVTYYTDAAAETATTVAGAPTTATVNGEKNGWSLDLSGSTTALGTAKVKTVVITYNAKLTADATTGGTGNDNLVELEYTNKLYDTTDPYTPVTPPTDPDTSVKVKEETTTIIDQAAAYTFGLELVKKFEGSAPAEGISATFDLYKADTTGDATIPGTSSVKGTKIGSYTTDANGKIVIDTEQTNANDTAFSNGDYYFVETKTAKEYNLLKEAVKVTIAQKYTKTFAGVTTVKTVTYDADGNEIKAVDRVLDTASESTTWGEGDGSSTTYAVTSLTVNNKKGFTFPLTGGRGTIIFTVVGIALMLAAVSVFFVSKKRRTN